VDSGSVLCYRSRLKIRLNFTGGATPDAFLLFRQSPSGPVGGRVIVQIFVRDNNVDQALKALKKKMQREGTFREMKRRTHYEKPSEKRAREDAEAVRRARKLARKRAQREGLLPSAPRKPAVAGPGRK
jgi:small subunit ribosomal protein S21